MNKEKIIYLIFFGYLLSFWIFFYGDDSMTTNVLNLISYFWFLIIYTIVSLVFMLHKYSFKLREFIDLIISILVVFVVVIGIEHYFLKISDNIEFALYATLMLIFQLILLSIILITKLILYLKEIKLIQKNE